MVPSPLPLARAPSYGRAAMTSPNDDIALPYRPCVGVALFNPDGLVFLGRRKSDAGPEHVADGHAWQMPQGGIDEGEAPLAAALRELHEETNVPPDAVTLLGETRDWLAYDLPLPRPAPEVVRLRPDRSRGCDRCRGAGRWRP